MATSTKVYPNDQHNSWDTGISIPSGYYISSISIYCAYGFQDNTMDGCTLYIGGVQLAVVPAGHYGAVSGNATGRITGTVVTCNRGEFSFRSEVTYTYTLTASAVSRTITRTVSPSGAGSITTKVNGSNVNSAVKNTTVAVAASANSGYVFKNWTTSPANLIASGASSFTMPDQNVTVTGNFWKLSTGTLSTISLTGGGTVTLTITMQNSSLSHKYNLSFGTGMETGDVSVAAGVSSVTISVPLSWSAQIPSAASKTGGTLTLKTYNGSTQIGSTTITGITYNVPGSAVPTLGTIMKSIARTIDGTTYPDIGDIYVQNHCGVRVQASATGAMDGSTVLSTISSMRVQIGSSGGSNFDKTVLTDSIDFTSGLLDFSGTVNITVTATDSRGRTAAATETITVTAYAAPTGSLKVWRVDSDGDPADMGEYGEYELTKIWSQIGNNTLSWSIAIGSDSESSPADSGDLLPSIRKYLSQTQEYTVTLTLTDGLETTVITAKIPSARFIMAFDSSGNRIGIMKFPNKDTTQLPSGKARTFEFSADTQIYIGNDTLEDYIASIVNSLIQ